MEEETVKILKYSMIIFTFFIFLSLWQDRSYAQEQNVTYLGDFCIRLSDPHSFAPVTGFLLKLGILSYGTGHYLLHDSYSNYQGSAVVKNDKVEISLFKTTPPGISYPINSGNLGGFESVFIVIDDLDKLTGKYYLNGFGFSYNSDTANVEANPQTFRSGADAWVEPCP
jgi:hypothetical protein